MNKFNDIIDTGIYPARKNRMTISFWANIMDMSTFSASNSIIHISVSDYLVFSFYSSAANVLSRCMVHQKSNPTAETLTTVTLHNNYFTSAPIIKASISATNVFANLNAKWFYMRCGMTIDDSKFFVYAQLSGTTYPAVIVENTIPKNMQFNNENISLVENFRRIYRKSDTITLKILNSGLVNTSVYIKNLYLFQEYFRETVQFQY